MTRSAAELDSMLSELLAAEEGLSDWTVNFIESIAKQREAGRRLSKKQAAKIEEVWNECLG